MFNRRKSLTVLIATQQSGVLPALTGAAEHLSEVRLEQREALSATGAYSHLTGAQLAIVDPEHLAGSEEEKGQLHAALSGARHLVVVGGLAFVQQPQRYLEQAVASSGLGEMLPPRAVAFTALAGGVGKTTLALAAARAFQEATRLPAAVMELSAGPPALLAVANVPGPTLYEALEQGEPLPVWEGVTLVGMNWELARLLPPERVTAFWEQVIKDHVFVAFDAPAWHPLFLQVPVEQYLVISDGRPEAVGAAVYLHTKVSQRELPAAILLNRAGVAGRLALPVNPALQLKSLRSPWQAGERVLKVIYPGWKG